MPEYLTNPPTDAKGVVLKKYDKKTAAAFLVESAKTLRAAIRSLVKDDPIPGFKFEKLPDVKKVEDHGLTGAITIRYSYPDREDGSKRNGIEWIHFGHTVTSRLYSRFHEPTYQNVCFKVGPFCCETRCNLRAAKQQPLDLMTLAEGIVDRIRADIIDRIREDEKHAVAEAMESTEKRLEKALDKAQPKGTYCRLDRVLGATTVEDVRFTMKLSGLTVKQVEDVTAFLASKS